MKKLALLLAAVFAVTGFANNDKDGKGDKSHGNPGRGHGASSPGGNHDDDDDSKSRGQSDQMGWKARQVTREDKRGIDAYYRAADESLKSNNWDAIASQIDFPVLMVTDDARGEGNGSMWNREQWLRTMKQASAGTPQNAKISARRKPFFITNDLVIVEIENRMQVGNQKMNYRSADLLIRRNGQWRTKASIEGGWGESMPSAGSPTYHQNPPVGGGQVIPPGNPKGPQGPPAPTPGNTQQSPTANTPDPKGTSGNPGDPKGTTTPTGPTGTGKGTSGQPGDPKGTTTTAPTHSSSSAGAPDAGTPDPKKGSRKDATTRPFGK